MTREEAIKVLLDEWKCIDRNDGINCDRKCESCDLVMDSFVLKDAYNMAIKALEQEPCDDANANQHNSNALNDVGQHTNALEVDAISRKSLKHKLQEHHDFFVNAYGGFSNLPQNDKARVDEILNCIAMVVNEPPVKPQYTDDEIQKIQDLEQAEIQKAYELGQEDRPTGHWITEDMFDGDVAYRCSECNELFWIESGTPKDNGYNFCPKCGKRLVEPQERSEE